MLVVVGDYGEGSGVWEKKEAQRSTMNILVIKDIIATI